MAKIPLQPQPKVPPIGFFEPISVDPKDMMIDVEYLLGILKKLNSMIVQLNANTEFIEEFISKSFGYKKALSQGHSRISLEKEREKGGKISSSKH